MQIYGPYRVSTAQSAAGSQRINAPRPEHRPPEAQRATGAPVDQLDLSSAAREASAAASAGGVNRLAPAEGVAGEGEIRIDRVAQIRREIASGSYDTDEKMDLALGRLLDTFG